MCRWLCQCRSKFADVMILHWQSQWHTNWQAKPDEKLWNTSQLAGVSAFAYTRIWLSALLKQAEPTTNYWLPETSG